MNHIRSLKTIPTKIPATIGYYAALFAFGLASAVLGPALPALAENSGVALGDTGVLFTTRGIGFLLGSLAAGRGYDSWKGHPLLSVALILTAVSLVFTPLAGQFWQLNFLMFATGFTSSNLLVGSNTLLIWLHRERVGPWLNGMHFVNGIGLFVAPLILSQLLIKTGRINGAFYLLAALCALFAVVVLLSPSPSIPTQENETASPQPRLDWRIYMPLALVFLLYVGAEVGFGGWIFSFVVASDVASEAVAGAINATFFGAFTLGRLFAIPLTSRFSNRQLLQANYIGSLLSLVLLLLKPDSIITVTIATAGLGLSLASTFPVLMAFVGKHLNLSGRINGALFAVTAVGAMLIPWLMGLLFASYGGVGMMLVVFGTVLLGLASFNVVLVRLTRSALTA